MQQKKVGIELLKTFDILLDIEKDLYSPANILFNVSRNDFESIQLNFTIMQDEKPVDLTGQTVEMAIKKPSGLSVYQAVEITDPTAGKAEARLSIQAYVEFGIHTAEIYIRDLESMAVTNTFYFYSREAIMETEEIQSVNDWSALQQALFALDKKPLLVDGVPTTIPEYVGQMAFDIVGKKAFISNEISETGWQLLAAGDGGGGGIVYWADIIGKPATFPPDAHDHAIADVIGLDTALAGKADDADLIPFITEAEADLKYAAKGETGTAATWGSITGDIAGQADLQAALAAKANTADLAAKANVADVYTKTEVDTSLAAKADAADLAAKADAAALAGKADAADLAGKANSADVYLKTETYSKTEAYNKTEVDAIVTGITEGGGTIVQDNLTSTSTTAALSANQGRILNESKADAAALAAKADAAAVYTKTEVDTSLAGKADAADLAGKANVADVYAKTEIDTALAAKADAAALAGKADAADLAGKADAADLAAKANSADVYAKTETYTKTEVDTSLAGKADDADLAGKANSADVYLKTETYSKTEVDTALAGKADDADLATKADAADLAGKANSADVYTKTEVDTSLAGKADDADLAGKANVADVYAKTETYNKTEVDTALAAKADSAALAAKADVAAVYTKTEVDTALGTKANAADLAGKADLNHTHTEADLTFGGTNAKTYVDDADNFILNTRMAGLTFWKGTQAAYDALTPDANTIYFITG
jgi:BppU N-terminal domain